MSAGHFGHFGQSDKRFLSRAEKERKRGKRDKGVIRITMQSIAVNRYRTVYRIA